MPNTLTEGRHTGGYIVSEANGALSREVVTILKKSGHKLQAGTVLGKVTASGKYAPVNFSASDGSQTATAILFDNVDATEKDRSAVVTVRHAEVKASALVWPAGAQTDQIKAALAQLQGSAIVAR